MGQTQEVMAERRRSTAEALDLRPADVDTLRARLRAAGADATPASAAKRLGIGANELDELKRAIATSGASCSFLARAAARTIVGVQPSERPRANAVFGVAGSLVFHRSASCESAKEAKLNRMAEAEAKKAGRRLCVRCKDEMQAEDMKPIPASNGIDAGSNGVGKRKKKPSTTKGGSGGRGSSAAQKRRRAATEARRRGITVEQLKAERRADAQRNEARNKKAKQLGISPKELQRREAAGA